METSILSPTWLNNFPFPSAATSHSVVVLSDGPGAGRREFFDPRSFLPFPKRGICPISEVVRVVYLGRLSVLSWPQPSNHREAGIYHQPRPRKVRFRLGYIDHFIK